MLIKLLEVELLRLCESSLLVAYKVYFSTLFGLILSDNMDI